MLIPPKFTALVAGHLSDKTIFIRSFIFRSMLGAGGYGFRGDARGPTTAEETTARIRMQFTLDYDRAQVRLDKLYSDPTRLVVPSLQRDIVRAAFVLSRLERGIAY